MTFIGNLKVKDAAYIEVPNNDFIPGYALVVVKLKMYEIVCQRPKDIGKSEVFYRFNRETGKRIGGKGEILQLTDERRGLLEVASRAHFVNSFNISKLNNSQMRQVYDLFKSFGEVK